MEVRVRPEMIRLAIHGAVLSVAMMVFACVAVGTFGMLGPLAIPVWFLVLSAAGVKLRFSYWKDFGMALKVSAIALLIFIFGNVLLAALGDHRLLWANAFSAGVQVMERFYLPFFWLPFAVGLIAGGILNRGRRSKRGVA